MVGHQGADRGQVHRRRHLWPATNCSGDRSHAEREGDSWTDTPVDQHLRRSDSGSVLGASRHLKRGRRMLLSISKASAGAGDGSRTRDLLLGKQTLSS